VVFVKNNGDNKVKAIDNSDLNNKVDTISYDVSKLERVFKMSDSETIAMAIRDVLIRDNDDEFN